MIAFFQSDDRIIFLSFVIEVIKFLLCCKYSSFQKQFYKPHLKRLQSVLHSVLFYFRSLYKVYIYSVETLIAVI